jgi:hypothetical protein
MPYKGISVLGWIMRAAHQTRISCGARFSVSAMIVDSLEGETITAHATNQLTDIIHEQP